MDRRSRTESRRGRQTCDGCDEEMNCRHAAVPECCIREDEGLWFQSSFC